MHFEKKEREKKEYGMRVRIFDEMASKFEHASFFLLSFEPAFNVGFSQMTGMVSIVKVLSEIFVFLC